jgi:hypothetical protein
MYGDTGLNTEINHGQALHPRHISLVVGINFIRLSIDRAYEGGGGVVVVVVVVASSNRDR